MATGKPKRQLPPIPGEIAAETRRQSSLKAAPKSQEQWKLPFGDDASSVDDGSSTVDYERDYPTPQLSFNLEQQDGHGQQRQ